MSDIIAPTSTLRRGVNTGDSVKFDSGPKHNARIQDVPNYTASLLQVGAEALNLADHIDLSVRESRATAAYNDFRIKVDQMTSDMMTNNASGLSNEELRKTVYDKINDYANKNLLSKDFMDDDRVRNKILAEYNSYATNISKTIYADNASKVWKTQDANLAAKLMLAANDAATAHNTTDGQMYEDKMMQVYDEHMQFRGIDPNSDSYKEGKVKLISTLHLQNVLQDLEDPGLSPYALRDKIKAMKGKMLIDDYTRALAAINARIRDAENKAALRSMAQQQDSRLARGHGTPDQVMAAATQRVEQWMADVKLSGEDSPYYQYSLLSPEDRLNAALGEVNADQYQRRMKFDNSTRFKTSLNTGFNKNFPTLPSDSQRRLIEESKAGTLSDAQLYQVSVGQDPYHSTIEEQSFAQNQIKMQLEAVENDPDVIQELNQLTMSVTEHGISNVSKEQQQTDNLLLMGMSDNEVIQAYQQAASSGRNTAKEFARLTGVRDFGVANSGIERGYKLINDAKFKAEAAALDGVTKALSNKLTKKYLSKDALSSPYMYAGIRQGVAQEYSKFKANNPNGTADEFYRQLVIEKGLTEKFLTDFSNVYMTTFQK